MEEIKPVKEKIFDFWSNFSIWFGADFGIAVIWAGALLTPYLSLKEALAIIILGHLLGNAVMSLIAIEGQETGLPTMVLSRGPLGGKGSVLPSFLNYLQLIGWTAIMLIVGARALDVIFPGTYYAWVIVLGILVTAWTIVGPERWRWLEKLSVVLLGVLSVWLLYVIFSKYSFSELWNKPGTGGLSLLIALDLVIAMPLSWAPTIADYSRFAKSRADAAWGTYLGHLVGSAFCYFLGALSNVAMGKEDPISLIAAYGLGIPAMLIVLISTLNTTFMDIYSASITWKNINPKANLKTQVLLVGTLGTLLALVFPVDKYEAFLLLIGGAFVPLAAIMITDYFLVKREYDAEKLLADESIRAPGIIAWVIGFILYLSLTMESLIGISVPVLSQIGNEIGASIPVFLITMVLYYILSRR
ncbi:putative hydroxymethylpyrimidine transporter CytX [Pyrococcus abyssi]|uniref:Purine-cytosine permease related n=1 Tax=Pyrococcus abyssi (strain GE5 / Orsay) TaxID=272844 RepID=Q9UZQ3_PYRAB|nr:putative hydroxymethylpyrimidine transporter CytX [Pyrococcus abyssi]CAB50003.1 codB-like purine-cytosine permease related [Pyrococcus abyssi GE5]CCE70505.1 TPA: purine-cytosine permease related [Pyrococcus abyssi GE5]